MEPSHEILRDENLRMKLEALAATRTQRIAQQILPRLRAGSPLDPEEVDKIGTTDFYWIKGSEVTAIDVRDKAGLEERYDLVRTPSTASPLANRSSAPEQPLTSQQEAVAGLLDPAVPELSGQTRSDPNPGAPLLAAQRKMLELRQLTYN